MRILGHDREGRTIEEIMNGQKGGKPWQPNEYDTDPDYSSVDSSLFEHLEALDKCYRSESQR